MPGKQTIFFSYSRIDGEKFAVQLATDLRKAGCNVWIDQLDIRPGRPWDIEIEKALEAATCILFIVTEKSTGSKNTLDEVYYAIDNNKEVIPAIFENCPIPFRLKRLQNIDFTKNYQNALTRLLEALKADSELAAVKQENELVNVSNENPANESNERKFTLQAAKIEKAGNSKKTFFITGGIIILLIFFVFIYRNKSANESVSNIKSTDTSAIKTDTSYTQTKPVENSNVLMDSSKNQDKNPKPAGMVNDKPKLDENSKIDTPKTSIKPTIIPPQISHRLNSDTNYYRLQLKNGATFLDAAYCGNKVVLSSSSTYADGACQLWRLVPEKNGWYALQLKNGGKYLMAENCSSGLVLIPSSEFDENDGCQLWRFVPAGDGWNRLQLQSGQKYLDADHCSTNLSLNPGSDFADGACQLWKFVH